LSSGLQFFQDKLIAVREMHRVLAPGGRVAIATWLSLADLPFVSGLHQVAEQHLGPMVDVRHSFGHGSAFPRSYSKIAPMIPNVSKPVWLPSAISASWLRRSSTSCWGEAVVLVDFSDGSRYHLCPGDGCAEVGQHHVSRPPAAGW
jgi:ubiquinone/menaquinone biosynthesis C-methylase UbiE